MRKTLVAAAVVFLCALAMKAFAAEAAQAGMSKNDTFSIIADAKGKVFPAVVFIKPIVEKYEGGEKKALQVTGSGVLISADGEVVTNFHVIDKAVSIRCMLFDGRHMDAELVGSDKETDLALLKLKRTDDKETFPFATLGDSTKLTEGQFVMAMGAPWGLNRSVSIGIVSCVKRYIPDACEYSLFIQTDASLNPGNSGGPLVDTDGEVIGINSRATTQGGDMGFAIPSETVKDIIGQIRAGGKVARSWTGIDLQPIQDFDQNMYFGGDHGVIISGCEPDSPGLKAGLRNGDRIVSVAGKAVTAMSDVDVPAVRMLMASLPADKPAAIVIEREGKESQLELTPRIKGKVEGEELDCPRWNMTVKTINQFANPDLYFLSHEGVYIFGTKYPGNAAQSGLQANDIIVSIDSKPIKTLDDVKKAYDEAINATPKRIRAVINVTRGGSDREVVLDFSREYKAD
jgi:serine protease Do